MASKVEWALSLLDKTSAPASKVERSLSLLEKRMAALDKAAREIKDPKILDKLAYQRVGLEVQKAQLEMRKMAGHTESWITKLHSALGVTRMIGGALLSVGSAVARTVVGFGKAGIEAASYRESTLAALEILTGSKASAKGVFNQGIKFAADTPFETTDVLRWQKGLLTGGFKLDEIGAVLKGMGDLAAMNDFDVQVADRIALAFKQIRAKGKFQGEEALQLAEAGAPLAKIYENLGKMLGKTGDEVRKLQQAGKITANQGIYATLEAIRDTVSGGKLGNAMDRLGSSTVTGLLSTLKGRKMEMLFGFGETKGFEKFKGMLQNLVAATDTTTGAGKRMAEKLASAFDRVFSSLFGDFSGPDGLLKIEAIIERIANFAESSGYALKGFGEGVSRALRTAFGDTAALFDGPMSPEKAKQIEEAFSKLGEKLGGAVDKAAKLAGHFDKIFEFLEAFGLFGKPEFADNNLGRWMNGAYDEQQKDMGFWGRAKWSFTNGLEGGGALLKDTLGVEPDGSSAISASMPRLPASFASNVSAPISISINGNATPETAQAVADAARRGVREAVDCSMSSAAVCAGAM